MFSESARWYDRLYDFKDYRAEAEKLAGFIGANLRSEGRRLLDVACGTGRHLEFLRARFQVEGLDLSEDLLAVAQERSPGVTFHRGDMTDFDLGASFDAVTCLFSSIGYVRTLENLTRAVGCMARHVAPGGVLIIEPWFTPGAWRAGTVHALLVDDPDRKIARVSTSFAADRISWFDFHYLIGTPEGTRHVVEHHELGLFETEEIRSAMAGFGLEVEFDPDGLTGRGLFCGRRGL